MIGPVLWYTVHAYIYVDGLAYPESSFLGLILWICSRYYTVFKCCDSKKR